jgi:hypothetical protein
VPNGVTRNKFFFFRWGLQPAVGFGLSNNTSPFFSYLSPAFSFFSLPALEDLFLLLLSILSLVFLFVLSLPVLSEDLLEHPILLHSLQVTQPTYPLPLYPF